MLNSYLRFLLNRALLGDQRAFNYFLYVRYQERNINDMTEQGMDAEFVKYICKHDNWSDFRIVQREVNQAYKRLSITAREYSLSDCYVGRLIYFADAHKNGYVRDGRNQEVHDEQAVHFFRIAITKGNILAYRMLADMYLEGRVKNGNSRELDLRNALACLKNFTSESNNQIDNNAAQLKMTSIEEELREISRCKPEVVELSAAWIVPLIQSVRLTVEVKEKNKEIAALQARLEELEATATMRPQEQNVEYVQIKRPRVSGFTSVFHQSSATKRPQEHDAEYIQIKRPRASGFTSESQQSSSTPRFR